MDQDLGLSNRAVLRCSTTQGGCGIVACDTGSREGGVLSQLKIIFICHF